MADTPNLGLVYLEEGQNQKEVTINENMDAIDSAFGSIPAITTIGPAGSLQDGPAVTLAMDGTGSDVGITAASDTVTFHMPDAAASARGLVSTGTQTIAGAKTFANPVTFPAAAAGYPSFNVPSSGGTAPSSPTTGDLWWDGTALNFRAGGSTVNLLAGGTGVTAISIASANGFTGSSSGGTTPALTIATSITGILKGNGTAISSASAGDFPTLNQDTTGNAATATALLNARTIGGVSFDGTANITVATATAGFTISGGNLALGANSITMTGSIGATGARVTKGWFTDLEATNAIAGSVTGNAGTATALLNARTIGGISFDGTANITVATATGGFTVSGGNLVLGANSLTLTGSIGATGARVTKGWFTDLEVTNPIVGSVTTNANLTGPITSVGNATSVGAQTGTGSTFVMNTSPTIVTPTIAKIANLSTNGYVKTTSSDGTLSVSSGVPLSDINSGTANRVVYGNGSGVSQSANLTFDASTNQMVLGATGTTDTGAGLLIQQRALQVTGRIDEGTTSISCQLGVGPSGDSARFLLGHSSGNWQIDNNAGSMRFFLPSNVRMTLTSTTLLLGTTTLTFAAGNIATDTTTGTKIGTATSQKFGFYNATPIVQPSGNALTALSNLGLISSPTLTSTNVGLGNVDNTSNATERAATRTLTNARITKRVLATAGPGATPTYNTDNYDVLHFTALAAAITSMTSSATGTPQDGDVLRVSFTDNGTARAITWGANFEASGTQALPTTTVVSTRLDVIFVWNTETSKWRCMAAS